MDGKQLLRENRIKMDREGKMKAGNTLEITKNQRRGAYVVGEGDTGRKCKKRKYVMVGKDGGLWQRTKIKDWNS